MGTDASAVHALDPSSAHPEDAADTVLCHTGHVKGMNVRGAALVSGSARRLAVHALVGKELRPRYCTDLDSVLCGLCPSAAALANRTVADAPSTSPLSRGGDNRLQRVAGLAWDVSIVVLDGDSSHDPASLLGHPTPES